MHKHLTFTSSGGEWSKFDGTELASRSLFRLENSSYNKPRPFIRRCVISKNKKAREN